MVETRLAFEMLRHETRPEKFLSVRVLWLHQLRQLHSLAQLPFLRVQSGIPFQRGGYLRLLPWGARCKSRPVYYLPRSTVIGPALTCRPRPTGFRVQITLAAWRALETERRVVVLRDSLSLRQTYACKFITRKDQLHALLCKL